MVIPCMRSATAQSRGFAYVDPLLGTVFHRPWNYYQLFYYITFSHSHYFASSVLIAYERYVGRGGALVESMTFNWRVVGLTPALAAT